MLRILKRLQPEDIIALIFAILTGILFLIKVIVSKSVFTGIWTSYYFFLIPFLLLIIKESISFLISSKPRFSGFIKTLRDWFPFLLMLSLYFSFYDGLNYFIVQKDMDFVLAKIDKSLFGMQASVFLEPLM